MSKRIWPKSEEHPPLAALTLHLEGELEGREAAAVSRHVNDCWTCRRELERLEKGVYAFVDYRRDVLLPSVPPPPERSSFVQRLREEATRERRPSLLQLARDLASNVPSYVSRTGWALGSVAAIVLAALTVYWFSSTPKLSASEFLRRSHVARVSSDTRRSAILYQKVQIRRGSSLFQQATYRGPAAQSLPEEQYDSPDPETVRALRLAGINWQDPLNADDFAVWHDAHPEGRDRVVRSADRVTLRSDEPRSSEVAAASLTVMTEDWHPVARYVEFRDQPPVEITELAYEFRYPPPVAASPEPPPAAPVSNAFPAPKPNAEAKSGLREAELDEDEMRLREAFHDIGADVREAPEVRKTERGVEFRVWADSGERKQEILRAAAGIPNVMPVSELESSASPDVPMQAAPTFSTQPPLAKALWDYLGGLDLANRFIANLSASFDRILTSAAAMARLSERYSANHWEQLTPDIEARVNRLAADYLAVIRSESGIYVGRMSPVLDEMLRRNQPTLEAETEPSVGCQAWQAFPPAVLADIKQLHTSFRRLFVEEQVETPILLRSDDLLRDSALARAHLSAHVRDVCQPLPVPSVEQR